MADNEAKEEYKTEPPEPTLTKTERHKLVRDELAKANPNPKTVGDNLFELTKQEGSKAFDPYLVLMKENKDQPIVATMSRILTRQIEHEVSNDRAIAKANAARVDGYNKWEANEARKKEEKKSGGPLNRPY